MDDFARVRLKNGMPVFNTGISNRDFAQAKLLQYLPQSGFIAAPAEDGAALVFSPWRFTETEEDSDGSVTLLGDPFEGTELASIFLPDQTGAGREKNWRLLKSVIAAYADAQRQGVKLPAAGPHAILAAPDGKLLFLPAELFTRSLQNRSDAVYSASCGCYVNPLLPAEEAAAFSCAVLLYRFLTGELPYPQPDSEKRCADYFDGNFLPLASFMEATCRESAVIDALLDKKDAKKTRPTLADLQSALDENPRAVPEGETFREKKAAATQKKTKSINRRRFFRKNQTILTIAAACLVLAVWGTFSFVRTQAAKETTAGLTALETVEMFYSAYNRLDVELMSACLERGAGKEFVNFVTNVFVTTKVRQAYEGLRETLTPAQYFSLDETKRAGRTVFGVYKLAVDGQTADENVVFDPNRDKKKQTGTKGEKAEFDVSYYFFMSQPEGLPLVMQRSDKLTLTYEKNRWLISEISSASEAASIETIKTPQ